MSIVYECVIQTIKNTEEQVLLFLTTSPGKCHGKCRLDCVPAITSAITTRLGNVRLEYEEYTLVLTLQAQNLYVRPK